MPIFENEIPQAYPKAEIPNRINDSLRQVQERLLQEAIDREKREDERTRDGSATPTDAERLAPPPQRAELSDVANRLQTKFGLGGNAQMRREFFARLEREVDREGRPVFEIIKHCVVEAKHTSNPARWFCKAVRCRLIEHGFLKSETREEF